MRIDHTIITLLALALAAGLGAAACNEADGTDPWPGVYPHEADIDRPKGDMDAARTEDDAPPDAEADDDAGPADAEAEQDASTDADGGSDAAADASADATPEAG